MLHAIQVLVIKCRSDDEAAALPPADIKKRSSSRSRRGRRVSRSRSRSRSHSRTRRKRSRSKHRCPAKTLTCFITLITAVSSHSDFFVFLLPSCRSRPPQRLWPRGDSHSSRGGHKRRSRSRDRRHSRSRSRCVGNRNTYELFYFETLNNVQ